ncbi:alanine:cation symporter family protein [Bacteriovoracaceae bacterium]|nr:alanine:cation symporter family protein [Bacteriovoracaceae bacterium]
MKKLGVLLMGFLVNVSAWGNEGSFMDSVDGFFGLIVKYFAPLLFWTVPIIQLPFILTVMVFGGIFFTFRYGFVNVRFFGHSINIIRGKYDDPNDAGHISHFQALTSALSATVGLGNIAGVAVAIGAGGPGAVFWMWIVAFFGMSMKFSSCTMAQLYRRVDKDGHVLGGPMVYLQEGFKEINKPLLGKIFAYFFAFTCIFASFGGGNMFQANQTFELLSGQFPVLKDYPLVVGVVLAIFAGIVLIGGITRIGKVTGKMVPLMCAFYCATCLTIIFSNYEKIPEMFLSIVNSAFAPGAMYGGFIGVLIQGVKRASFSNEAGLGSAAMAHAAAKTKEPVREGIVAMIGPFIDTHLVCTMTALTILITGVHLDPALAGKGALMTAAAFGTLGSMMPMALTIATAIFAYSTIISWSYYGECATEFVFGRKAIKYYRMVYVLVICIGPIVSLGNVIDFADLLLLSMAFPNIIGMMILSGTVKGKIEDYARRKKIGFKIYQP